MIRVGIAFYEWKVRTLKENEVFELKLEELNKLLVYSIISIFSKTMKINSPLCNIVQSNVN